MYECPTTQSISGAQNITSPGPWIPNKDLIAQQHGHRLLELLLLRVQWFLIEESVMLDLRNTVTV